MIRIGLPIPTLFKMTLRVQLASAQISRSVRKWLLGDSAAKIDREHAIVSIEPSVLEPIDLEKFEHRYQDLIDLLCVSAKENADGPRSRQYMELQDWFGSNYGIYRGILLPYLRLEPDEADPFEAMFMHPNLADAINANELILHAQQTRAALENCRAQAERTAV